MIWYLFVLSSIFYYTLKNTNKISKNQPITPYWMVICLGRDHACCRVKKGSACEAFGWWMVSSISYSCFYKFEMSSEDIIIYPPSQFPTSSGPFLSLFLLPREFIKLKQLTNLVFFPPPPAYCFNGGGGCGATINWFVHLLDFLPIINIGSDITNWLRVLSPCQYKTPCNSMEWIILHSFKIFYVYITKTLII